MTKKKKRSLKSTTKSPSNVTPITTSSNSEYTSTIMSEGENRVTAYTTSTFTIETYDPRQHKWSRWVKRLEVAFTVFEVPDKLKLHYLLHYMGSDAYNTLCDTLAPEVPEDKDYNSIVATMDKFYDPAPLEIAETFRFQSRRQQEGESVNEFLHALQKLAINCKFGHFFKDSFTESVCIWVACQTNSKQIVRNS